MSDRWRTRTLWCLACLSLGPAAPAAALFPPLELAWRFSAPGGFYSPPFVSGEQLFLGGLDGTVYALTTAGDLLWKHAVGGQLYGGAVADAERVYAASEQKVVVALDRATGDERWRRDLDGLVYAAPRLVGDNLLVGTGDTGTVYCFAAATGEERWRFPLGARMGSGMEVADGMVYLPSFDSHLYAVEIATGLLRWQFVAAGAIDSRPLAAGDRLYLKLGNDIIYALRRADGELLWQSGGNGADPPATPTNWSALALAGERLLYGSLDARLHAVSESTGRDLWMTGPTSDRPAPPTPAGELGYAGGKDGCLEVIDLASGRMVWLWRPDADVSPGQLSGIMWPPVIVGARLYAASMDGHLYAFNGQTDPAVWEASRQTTTERPAAGQAWPDNLPSMSGPGAKPSAPEIEAVRVLGGRVRGFVVWESNRDGAWDLYRLNTDGSDFRALTDFAAKRSPLAYDGYLRPQVSPDGRTILFACGRRRAPVECWLVSSTGGDARKVADGAPLNWLPDGDGFYYAQGRAVLRYRLAGGRSEPLPGLELNAEADPWLVGTVRADGAALAVGRRDDETWQLLAAGQPPRSFAGEAPRFVGDGPSLLWSAGPQTFQQLAADTAQTLLQVPTAEPQEHIAFPALTVDGRWLTYAAASGQRNHDVADYEIYVQEMRDAQPAGERVRLTWHQATDRWPALHVLP